MWICKLRAMNRIGVFDLARKEGRRPALSDCGRRPLGALRLLMAVSTTSPAELKRATLSARQGYVRTTRNRAETRTLNSSQNLGVDEATETAMQLRRGEVLVMTPIVARAAQTRKAVHALTRNRTCGDSSERKPASRRIEARRQGTRGNRSGEEG